MEGDQKEQWVEAIKDENHTDMVALPKSRKDLTNKGRSSSQPRYKATRVVKRLSQRLRWTTEQRKPRTGGKQQPALNKRSTCLSTAHPVDRVFGSRSPINEGVADLHHNNTTKNLIMERKGVRKGVIEIYFETSV
ncbi:hypothetical protein Dimus_037001 [Dionaea muscipula]